MPARTATIVVLLLAAFALVTRGQWIGNPLPQEDEQFYVLVANRLWHGDLPYVDIWDRKPIGLFLLYAAFVPFGGHGLVAYGIGALVCAVATAFVVVRIALRVTILPAAVGGAVLYMVNLQVFGGGGGQSPVFYNLPMAVAALLVLRSAEQPMARRAAGSAVLAMALVGLAIQIKYTAFVEGILFGCAFGWLRWRRSRSLPETALFMALLVVVALLPTLAAFAFYALHGHAAAFVQANVLSIFLTVDAHDGASRAYLLRDLLAIAPLAAVAAAGAWVLLAERPRAAAVGFLLPWLLFALIGFGLIGRFYPHYLLPSLLPLTVLAAGALRRTVPLATILGLFIGVPAATYVLGAQETVTQNRRYLAALVEALQPYTAYGCLYLRDGPTMAYVETRSCLPSPYVFPDHLSKVVESRATDAQRSLARMLAGRPAAIALSLRPPGTNPYDPATERMLTDELKANYRPRTEIAGAGVNPRQRIYVRSDLP